MSAEIQDLAVRYGAAWAARDLDAIVAMHTDDTVFHLHGGGEPAISRGATREAFAAALAAWPDIRFDRKRVHIGAEHFVSEYEMHPSRRSLDLACEDVFALQCPADLLDVHCVHAREPVETRHVERRDPRYTGGSRHPLGQTCGNRQTVRPAPGAAA